MQLDKFIEDLIDERKLLSEEDVKNVCEKLKEILCHESNVLHIQAPVTVVGDVHGQFSDVLEIFKMGVLAHRQITSFWGIMWIEGFVVLKQYLFLRVLNFVTRIELLFYVEITRVGRLRKYMDFIWNVYESN
jgi:hypothetical protein